jgi:hypothetical protein
MRASSERDVRLGARTSERFQGLFKAKAESVGLNMSEALLKLAEKFVKGEISLNDEETSDCINKLEKLEQEIIEMKQQIEVIKESRQGK